MTVMPELPEVENVCLGLADSVVGRRVERVTVRRMDVVHGPGSPTDLLRGRIIRRIDRLGKQFALVGQTPGHNGPSDKRACVCLHLGMTGSMRFYPQNTPYRPDDHTHVVWRLSGGGRLAFRDPRRFGGLWTFDTVTALNETRWSKLGEDALTITPARLHMKLKRTRRPIKSALLDQATVAGLGNIYADELLFSCGLHPMRPGCDVTRPETQRLVRKMRALLNRAINLGGSTLRDYVDTSGRSGGFQKAHRVYGRKGQACHNCRRALSGIYLSGRATVYCGVCQT